jgi:hypothetical protein
MPNDSVLDAFLAYREALAANLRERSEVLGLIFVGSAADTSRVDEWSDHDFFVVTQEGTAEGFRQDLTWLPDHEEIVIRTRETAHGLKVIFGNGHVLEFAIFNDSELELAGANVYAVFIDEGNIEARMAAIAERSKPGVFEPAKEFELLLAHLLIGIGRFRRGEVLIAGQQIRSYALNHVLGLVRHVTPPAEGTETAADNLNRFRRFECQYPQLAAEIENALQSNVEACAIALLKLVLGQLGSTMTEQQLKQVSVIKRTLNWS